MPKLEITVSSTDALDIRRFVVHEALSRPFAVDLWVRSTDASIDLDAIVGLEATFRAESDHPAAPLGGIRELVGRVQFMRLVESEPGMASTYHLRVVPALWLLSLRNDLRLFQDASLPTMVDVLLEEWNIKREWKMNTTAAPVVPVRTQYEESDLAFVSRLLEEAGISYTFSHHDSATWMVLHDSFHTDAPRPGPVPYYATPNPKDPLEWVTGVRVLSRHEPARVTLGDHDFLRPDKLMRALAGDAKSRCEWRDHLPASSDSASPAAPSGPSVGTSAGDTPVADDRGAYRRNDEFLSSVADLTLAAFHSDSSELLFELATIDLQPGMTFEIADHPELPAGTQLLCTEVTVEGSTGGTWTTIVRAVPAARPHRPLRSTPRPRVGGPLSATVVGPDKGEIFTDEHGRVRVQFIWDRRGRKDDKSSPWIRVMMPAAGSSFGSLYLPRVGQEVLVDFEQGNPDAPVILSRLYNRGEPVPYRLPEHATKSGVRSASSPGGTGWNEIVLEDTAGEELFFSQAEKNARRLVKNDERLTTAGRRQTQIGTNETDVTVGRLVQETRGDRTEITRGRRTEETEGEHDRIKIRKDAFDRIEVDRYATTIKNDSATVAGSRFELVGLDSHIHTASRIESFGSLSRNVRGSIDIGIGEKGSYLVKCADAHIMAKDDIVLDAPDITAKGGGGFVRCDPAGVTIVGTMVKINDGGSAGDGVGVGVSGADVPREALIGNPVEPARLPEQGLGAEVPKGPPAPVTVRILGPTGTDLGCSLVPKGKEHDFTAIGSPDGGTFKWVAKGGATVSGAATNQEVKVKGATVSAKLDAAELEVEYTTSEGTAKAARKLTVFEITKLEARLRATPCLRTKTRADAMAAKSSAKDVKTIDASAVTVVRGSGELALEAIVKPEGVPITWWVERATDDDPSLSGVPSHAQASGGANKRRLRLDATGSFHVHGFVDCDGDGERGPDEKGLIMNVNMVEATVLPGAANNRQILKRNQFTSANSTAAFLVVNSGLGVAPASPYKDGAFAVHAQAAKLGVKLLGGGADGKRGIAEIGAGYVQVSSGDTFRATYADGRTEREVIVSNPATPEPIVAGTPGLLSFPIRDTRGTSISGRGAFIIGSDDLDRANLPEGGQKRILRMIDSPAIVARLNHVTTGSALARISGSNSFKIMASVFSSDFPENFSTLASANWKATYGTFTSGVGWTNVGANITGDKVMRVHHPVQPSEFVPSFERCLPNFVDALRMDAR